MACFTADVLALTHRQEEASRLQHQAKMLDERFKGLAPKGDEAELCKSVIFGLNAKLRALKCVFGGGAVINPIAITPAHRALFRAGLRQMGTWIGVTELELLANLFGVRFFIALPEGALFRRIEVGHAGCPSIGNPALLWSGIHYELATLAGPNPAGLYTAAAIVQTNPFGDCAIESFLLLLLRAPAVIGQLLMAYPWQVRSVLRQFGAAAARPLVNNVIAANDADYIEALTDLRKLMAAAMSDAQVDDAIIAEGELPESEEAKAAKAKPKVKGGKVPAPALDGLVVNVSKPAKSALPWRASFAIVTKRINQVGFHPVQILPLSGSTTHVVGGNTNFSAALWPDSLAFLNAACSKPLLGGYDADAEIYVEQVDKKQLAFLHDEGVAMNPRSTHFCSCLAVITTRDGSKHHFLFAGVNMRPGNGKEAKALVSTLAKGQSGTHSEKYCFSLLAHVLRGFGVVISNKVMAAVSDCSDVNAAGALGASNVTGVDVMFLNIACMCDTCEGFWGQFRASLLEAGVQHARCYQWYFIGDIKDWK